MLKRKLQLTIALTALVLIQSSSLCQAQTFSFTCNEPTQPGHSGGENVFVSVLANTSSTDPYFTLDLDDFNIGDWVYFWCVGAICLGPGTYTYNDTLLIGEADSILVHMFPDSATQNQGSVTITAYPQSVPGSAQSLTFTAYFGTGMQPNSAVSQPGGFELSPPHPNPFNPATSFSFTVDDLESIGISVYNQNGQCIRHLFRGLLVPGSYTFIWDGRDNHGRDLPSSPYIITINHGEHLSVFKVVKMN